MFSKDKFKNYKEYPEKSISLNLPLSPYICPICEMPFWIIRECNSSFDLSLGRSVRHTPVQTIPRKY